MRCSNGRRRGAFFLCNPQNPGGTVFRRAELERLAELTRDSVIVSDEIHCDLILDKALRHVPIASLVAGDLAPHGDADVAEQDLQLPGRRLRLGDHRGSGSAQGVLRRDQRRT